MLAERATVFWLGCLAAEDCRHETAAKPDRTASVKRHGVEPRPSALVGAASAQIIDDYSLREADRLHLVENALSSLR
jgi:hypothetical protein